MARKYIPSILSLFQANQFQDLMTHCFLLHLYLGPSSHDRTDLVDTTTEFEIILACAKNFF